MPRRAWIAGAWVAATAFASWADPPATIPDLTAVPFEQLTKLRVSGASQFDQSIRDAPSAVVVLTAADIRQYHWRTLADALATLPGVYINYDRNYDYIGTRGFLRPGDYNSRFLLLVNGNRQNDAVYDEATVGTEFVLDVDTIERIEYIPGPGSAIYGSNAFFGVINVVTRDGQTLNGARFAAETGSFGETKGRASFGWHGADGADLLLSASVYNNPGADQFYPDFDTPGQNNGVAHNLDYDRADNGLLRGAWGGFTFTLAGSTRTKGIPTASFGQDFDDPRSKTNDSQGFGDLAYRGWLGPTTELQAHIFKNYYDYHGDYAFAPAPALQIDASHSDWYGMGAYVTTTALEYNKIQLGADLQRDGERNQNNYNINPYTLNLNDVRSYMRGGLYLEDEIALRSWLLLNAGARFDDDSTTGSHLNPRAALIWKALSATTLKAIFGTAYRAPNAYELYYAVPGPGGEEPNTALGAEHISTYEVVAQQGLFGSGLLTSSVYRYAVHDLISLTTDPVSGLLIYRNVDQVNADGVELGYEQRFDGGGQLRTSYSWQHARNLSGAPLLNSPRQLAKLNYSLPLSEWVRIGEEIEFVDARAANTTPVGPAWIDNLTLLAKLPLVADGNASLTAYNLFNRRNYDPAGPAFTQNAIEQDGLAVLLKLTLGFQ